MKPAFRGVHRSVHSDSSMIVPCILLPHRPCLVTTDLTVRGVELRLILALWTCMLLVLVFVENERWGWEASGRQEE